MENSHNSKAKVYLDLRIVCAVLVAIIIALISMWRPWNGAESTRTVEVMGDAQVMAVPDEFVFYPNYQFKDANKEVALNELSKKSSEVTTALRGIGVAENKIKTTSNGGAYSTYESTIKTPNTSYSLQFTVTVSDRVTAQKVEDYLVTTQPLGEVSPQPTFSEKKRKELEDKARILASKDARIKADTMAGNLGFKVGKVKTIVDNAGFGQPPYMAEKGMPAMPQDAGATSSLVIQPGENELPYSIKVTYFIR